MRQVVALSWFVLRCLIAWYLTLAIAVGLVACVMALATALRYSLGW